MDPEPEPFVPDPVPARMKELINKIIFKILSLWILDCSGVHAGTLKIV